MVIQPKETQIEKDDRILNELISSRKTDSKIKIKEKLQEILSNGFEFMGKFIQADDDSRSYFSEYYIKKDVIPYPVNWRTLDNSYLSLTDSTIIDNLSDAMMLFYGTIMEEYFLTNDEIDSSTTEEEIDILLNEYISK